MITESQIEIRKNGIGGSDAAAVCGVSRYKTQIDVFLDKTQEVQRINNSRLFLGNMLESWVVSEFEKQTGKVVSQIESTHSHPEYPFMIGNVDGFLPDENAIVECKTTFSPKSELIQNQVSPEYMLQLQHYMAVYNADKAYLVGAILLIDRNDEPRVTVIEVNRDEKMISDMISIESHFWNEYVVPRVIPPFDFTHPNIDSVFNTLYPNANDEPVYLKTITSDDINRLNEVKRQISELIDKKSTIEYRIKAEMKESPIAYFGDEEIHWKQIKSFRIDTKKLKEEYPEIYEKCQKQTTFRRFEIK